MDTSRVEVRPAYAIPDFCRAFGIGRSTLYEEIRSGRIASFKVGRRTLIAGEEGLRWLQGCRERAESTRASEFRNLGPKPGEAQPRAVLINKTWSWDEAADSSGAP